MKPTSAPEGIGGWLLVLCALLIVWQPMILAIAVSGVLRSILLRGFPAFAVLGLRLAVTALGAGAGMALAFRRESAVTMTKVSLAASAATDLFVLLTPYFPGNRVPGDEPYYAAAILLNCAVWMTYLLRSRRVRHTFSA